MGDEKKRRARPKWDELELLELYLAGMAYGRSHATSDAAGDLKHAIGHVKAVNKLS